MGHTEFLLREGRRGVPEPLSAPRLQTRALALPHDLLGHDLRQRVLRRHDLHRHDLRHRRVVFDLSCSLNL